MDADQDSSRQAIAASNLTAEAVNALSSDAYEDISFDELPVLKNLLKVFFSDQPWTAHHETQLADLVGDVGGYWTHTLSNGATLQHGMVDGRYLLSISGGEAEQHGLFNRLFTGPIVPEATPNPRHIRFPLGGAPGPSVFYQRGDEDLDPRIERLFEDPEVTDVLVAPDFVAVGLTRAELWESSIDRLLEEVTTAFQVRGEAPESDAPTRDELVSANDASIASGRLSSGSKSAGDASVDLHLLDPDKDSSRSILLAALDDDDPRRRRLALATVGNSVDQAFVRQTLSKAWVDRSRIVRRTAVDVAADNASEWVRPLLERALDDDDAWIRWKALRGLVDIGPEASIDPIKARDNDPDFRVRLEAHTALRITDTSPVDSPNRVPNMLNTMDHVNIQIAPDPETASARAAAAIADSLIGSARDPLFGLAGGSTPRRTYEILAELDVDWSRVIGFLGDERWVPHDHPESNLAMIKTTALGRSGMHLLGIEYGDDPAAAAAAYETELRAAADQANPAVLFLGMGDDGHTASLFPGTAALTSSGRDYVANWVEQKQTWRLTATFDLIARVEHVMFLVTGTAKADRVAEVLSGSSELPAARATAVARQVTWFLDGAAASRLDH